MKPTQPSAETTGDELVRPSTPQVAQPSSRWETVYFTRLAIEDGDELTTLALHPRLTVVSGVDQAGRAGLVAKLIGALGSTRRGLNLELCDDSGRNLAVLRPQSGQHRVVDLNQRIDVSEEFRGPDGRLDVLARYGLDATRAGRLLHLDHDGLKARAEVDDDVNRLAEVDQAALWSAAARVRLTDDELANAGSSGQDDGHDDLVAKVEQRHQALERASQQRRVQRDATLVCGVALIGATVATLYRPVLALPLLAIAVLTALATLGSKARVAAAERQEQAALAAAGAESYLGFVVNRVDDMIETTESQRRRLALAEDHRHAAERWIRLAGNVSVSWALDHHEEIEAAHRLRRELATLGQMSTTAPELDPTTTAMTQALVTHLAKLRTVGTGGESFPLVLEDPFTDVAPSTKLTLVELLARTPGSPQVILLTDQDEVTSWARLESLTGEVALVEPEVAATHTRRTSDLAV